MQEISEGCPTSDLSGEAIRNHCPVCHDEGLAVSPITVAHLVGDEYSAQIRDGGYNICKKDDCEVVYYNVEQQQIFFLNQIKVPIWFKKDANPKYACYCSQVTEEQVIDAVTTQGARTVQEVNIITGAMRNCNCKINNPLGGCCHPIIQGIIDKESLGK